jgi:hypothetical protein
MQSRVFLKPSGMLNSIQQNCRCRTVAKRVLVAVKALIHLTTPCRDIRSGVEVLKGGACEPTPSPLPRLGYGPGLPCLP